MNYLMTLTQLMKTFIQKAMPVVDNLAPIKNKHIKGTSQNWFDAEIMGKK